MDAKTKCELFGCSIYLQCGTCKTDLQFNGQQHECSEKCTKVIKPVLCGSCKIRTRVPKRYVFNVHFVLIHFMCIISSHDLFGNLSLFYFLNILKVIFLFLLSGFQRRKQNVQFATMQPFLSVLVAIVFSSQKMKNITVLMIVLLHLHLSCVWHVNLKKMLMNIRNKKVFTQKNVFFLFL